MRIVQLANMYSPTSGGLRTVVDALGRGYRAAGHDRILVVPGARAAVRRSAEGQLIALPGVPVGGGYRMVVRPSPVLRLLDRLAPDAVEVSDKATFVAVGGWARERGVRAVLFSHERLDAILAARVPAAWRCGGPVLRSAVRRWNRHLAASFETTVVTSAFAEREFAALGVSTLRRVPLGVDLDVFRPARPSRRQGPLRLVYAGRLSPEKNPQAAIEAVRALGRAGIPVRLDVHGDGSARDALARRAVGLPVTFHGHLPDRRELARRLAAADVALAPCPVETFGLSVLEALACGTPVVAAAGGAASELLVPGTGVAAAPTGEGMARGVREVLSWPVAERRGAARGRAECFPWSATVEAMLAVHAGRPVTPSGRFMPQAVAAGMSPLL
jgi:alpha-1,6-mannosyltransferase